MRCPRCEKTDIVIFNEAHVVKAQRFDGLAVFLLMSGIAITVISAAFLYGHTKNESTAEAISSSIAMFAGLAVLFAFFVRIIKARYITVYRVKVVCKNCGYQFFVEQKESKTLYVTPGSKKVSDKNHKIEEVSQSVEINRQDP